MTSVGSSSAWSVFARCPIPARISPYADAAQEWLTGWLGRFAGAPTGPAPARLAGAGFARYAARLFPGADEVELRTLAALFTWFFLVDDLCDGRYRSAPEQIEALRRAVLELLQDDQGRSRHPGLPEPLREMLADAWSLPRHRMPPLWRDRFVATVAHHLDGSRQQAANRAAGHLPSVAEYVELRRATSAAYVSYALLGFATGRMLPESVCHHPTVRQLATTGNDLLSWFNDVVSLERDSLDAGGHNLVLALARERSVPPERAVELVVERWQEAMRRFVTVRATVPSFGPALDAALTEHLDGVADSVRGTIDWTMESDRYSVARG